jgi:hypothetical protein
MALQPPHDHADRMDLYIDLCDFCHVPGLDVNFYLTSPPNNNRHPDHHVDSPKGPGQPTRLSVSRYPRPNSRPSSGR